MSGVFSSFVTQERLKACYSMHGCLGAVFSEAQPSVQMEG